MSRQVRGGRFDHGAHAIRVDVGRREPIAVETPRLDRGVVPQFELEAAVHDTHFERAPVLAALHERELRSVGWCDELGVEILGQDVQARVGATLEPEPSRFAVSEPRHSHSKAPTLAVVTDAAVWIVRTTYAASVDTVLRDILGGALGTDPNELAFDRRCAHCNHPTHGKPVVVGAPELSFSLSHSGAVTVIAVAPGARVGADVEIIRPRRYLDRLAARILMPAELADWQDLPVPERLPRFLRHWTEREAYLKGLGVGLVRPLRDALADAGGWTLAPIDGLDDAVGTVALEGGGRVLPPVYAPIP